MIRLRAVMVLATLAVPAGAAECALVLDVDGAIGPAVADYVVRELHSAAPNQVAVVVLRMNTPGGLDTSMRQIISAILASPVPVVSYVAPSGARAASAGTYIAYASALAAMAPGTNIGAATPVALGGPMLPGGSAEQKQSQQNKTDESGDTETRKVVNDAIAYIRSLAALNGRNADWAADAVRSAVSLPAADALSLHVIDVIADNVPDLLRQIDGRTVKVAGKPERLATAGLDVVTVPPYWRTELLSLVTNPNVAFILLLIGVYGLILEFFNPGAVAPGLIGAISLFVALYALALLPINYAGAALVLIGIGLMIAEAHIGAFGAIGVGGVAAFVIGALIMFPSRAPGFALSYAVVIGTALCSAALFLLALAVLLRSRKRPVMTGSEALIGAAGEAVSWQGGEGRVRVKGEIWLARADAPLAAGTHVKVLDRDGLVLRVQPLRRTRSKTMLFFPPIIFIAVLALIFLWSSIRILREYERGVVFTLGRYTGTKGPGLFLLVPFIQQMVRVDLRVIVDEVPPQDVISRDNVSVKVSAVIYFRVVDPERAIIQVSNYMVATSQLAQTTLRWVLGKHDLDEMLAERDKLNSGIQDVLDKQTEAWGIKVANVELKRIDLDESMVRAIARQAEAERERRAKIINAEGEQQAAQKLVEAARTLAEVPQAMQLRYLGTLFDIASERGSTIVFPFPIELASLFSTMAQKGS